MKDCAKLSPLSRMGIEYSIVFFILFVKEVKRMTLKNRVAKTLAPVAHGTSKEASRRVICGVIFHQRKLPNRQMRTVK